MPEDKAAVERQEDQLPMDSDVPDASDMDPSGARRRFDVLRSRWDVLLVISAGGALGSLARWATDTDLSLEVADFMVPDFAIVASEGDASELGEEVVDEAGASSPPNSPCQNDVDSTVVMTAVVQCHWGPQGPTPPPP